MSDKLYHKRKARKLKSLKREAGKREPYKTILIICEGDTESKYLTSLRNELHLNPANVQIKTCQKGNDPLSVAKESLSMYEEYEYDEVFCVFDKDQHSNYSATCNLIRTKKETGAPIHAIHSIPCFEYWLLLHYEDSDKPYKQAQKGGKSACAQIESLLKKYIKDYSKNDKIIFEKTKAKIDIATQRAKRLNSRQIKSGTDNPSTKIYELVEYMQNMKNKN